MKDAILEFLKLKNPKEFHSINAVLKETGDSSQSHFTRIKQLLKELHNSGEVEVEGNYSALGLSDGVTYSNPDGSAAPARAHTLDTINISARGLGQKIQPPSIESGDVTFPEAQSFADLIEQFNNEAQLPNEDFQESDPVEAAGAVPDNIIPPSNGVGHNEPVQSAGVAENIITPPIEN